MGKWFGRKDPREASSAGDAPSASITERKGVMIMGSGYAATIWAELLTAAGIEFAQAPGLAPDVLARTEFEVLIETRIGPPDGGDDESPDISPALVEGGLVLVPCYAAAPTVRASELGALAPRAAGYTLFRPPDGSAPKLVEIGRAAQTADDAWQGALDLVKRAGLSPEPVGDLPGFVFGREIACLINEAFYALDEGIALPADLDKAMLLGVNYPKGLLAWANDLGLELVTQIMEGLFEHYGEDRYRLAPGLRLNHISQSPK